MRGQSWICRSGFDCSDNPYEGAGSSGPAFQISEVRRDDQLAGQPCLIGQISGCEQPSARPRDVRREARPGRPAAILPPVMLPT